ncbi:MAG: hypothetical protein JSS78_05685, partial [Bacteroidetes bacterium]|nr:hypothetical protein [Bacteroidota bacterium]
MSKIYLNKLLVKATKLRGYITLLLLLITCSIQAQTTIFSEDWSSNNYTTNSWTFTPGQGNWQMGSLYTPTGATSPNAYFNWSPSVTNYSYSLVSKVINGTSYVGMTIDYKLLLDDYGGSVEQMKVEYKKVIDTSWTLLTNYSNSSGSFNVTPTNVPLSGTDTSSFQIRFTAYGQNSYNINGWGLDDIVVKGTPSTNCSGTPTAGIISGTTSICPSTAFVLNLTGNTVAAGITYKWQRDSLGTFVNIAGATSSSYNVLGGISSMNRYQVIVSCGASSATTPIDTVNVAPSYTCYCKPPAVTLHSSVNDYISNVVITGTTLNSSNTTNPSTGYTQVSPTPSSNTATLIQLGSYNLVCTINTAVGIPLTAGAWLDANANGIFEASEYTSLTIGSTTVTGTIMIPITAVAGQTGLRLRFRGGSFGAGDACATFGSGETEDYVVTIANAPPCSGIPVIGSAYGPSGNIICANAPFSLHDTGYAVVSGITYTWESSPAGANTWTTIATATSVNYTVTSGIATATDFRFKAVCSNGGGTTYSNTVSMSLSPFYLCYCGPATGIQLNSYPINYLTNVTIVNTTLNDTTTTVPANGYSLFWPTAANTTTTLVGGAQYTINLTHAYSGYYSGVWLDFNQDGVFDTSEFIPVTVTGTLATGMFTVPVTVQSGMTGLRARVFYNPYSNTQACTPTDDYETEDYVVTLAAATQCISSQIQSGTASAPSDVCSGQSFQLHLTGNTVGLGISVQWYSSPSGANNWSVISGATNSVYTVSNGVTAATDYYALVTCSNGGGNASSNTVSVNMNPFYICYCTPLQSYPLNYITNVNIPATTLNDTTTTTTATGYNLFYPTTTNTTAQLTQGNTYTVNVTNPYSGYFNGVWIDFNGNGTFDSVEFIPMTGTTATHSGTFTVPLTAFVGNVGMRIRVYYTSYAWNQSCAPTDGYETEDYVLDIAQAVTCSGTPNGGTVTGPTSACAGVPFNLTVIGQTTGIGISTNWQSSPAGSGTWSNIAGATNPILTVSSQIVATDYRFVDSCSVSGIKGYSNVISLTQNLPMQCYCTPTTAGGTSYYITNVTTTGAATNINNSTSSGTATGYHDYTAITPLVVLAGYSFNYSINIAGGSNYGMAIWIDTNMDGTFQTTEQFLSTSSYVYPPVTGSISIPSSARLGTTRIRILAAYTPGNPTNPCSNTGSGEYQDYLISISAPSACTGTPTAGTATTNVDTLCVSGNVKLSLTGYTIGVTGIQIQWQSSPAGAGTWVNLTGATADTFTVVNVNTPTDFRAVVTCTASSGTANSNTKSIVITNPTVAQTFPGSRCGTGNVTLLAIGANGANIKWYDSLTGGNLLSTGNAFISPVLSTTTTYYAAPFTGGGGAPTVIPTPNVNTDYTGGTVRGFYFTAPCNFTITGINAKTIATTGSQSIGIVRFNGNTPPPVYATTTNAFTTLFFTQNNPATGVIPVNIPVYAGDVIGVLGQRGNSVGYPATSGAYTTTINGNSVVLTRLIEQNNLSTTPLQDLAADPGGNIGLLDITYTIGCEGTRTPVTATVNAAATGTGLAAGGTTVGNTQSNGTTVAYTSSCNDTVAVINSGATNIGTTAAIVLTSPTVQTLGNKPFVPRAYDITPGTNGPATVTLYVLQSEFNAYNTWVTANAPSTPLLPSGPSDVTHIPNIVVTQYHGSASAGNKGPLGLYANTSIDFIPNSSITVTPIGSYWKLTFPVTGFSGFFIHSGTTPLAIDLKTISATNVGTRNRVDWTTGVEKSGDMFEVERSVDGRNFTYLASIKGKGEASTYSYWDQSPV